jgi:hypothetical protein
MPQPEEPAPTRFVLSKAADKGQEDAPKSPTRVVVIRPNPEETAPKNGTPSYPPGNNGNQPKSPNAVNPFRPGSAATQPAEYVDPFQPQGTRNNRRDMQPFSVPPTNPR